MGATIFARQLGLETGAGLRLIASDTRALMNDNLEMKGACGHCGGHIVFPAEMQGQMAGCPHCERATMLKPMRARPAQPVSKKAAAASVSCPQCRKPMGVEDVICVACGFRMPSPIPWLRVAVVAVMVLELGYLALRWTGLDSTTRAALAGKLGIRTAAVVSTGGPTVVVPKDSNQTVNAAPPQPVEPAGPDQGTLTLAGTPALKEDGDFHYIQGTVKNNSKRDVFYEVKVKFRLMDKNGAALGEVQDYAPFIEPGKSWDFRVLVVDIDATKYEFIEPIGGRR